MRHRLVLVTGWLLAVVGGLAGIAVLTSQSPAARPQVRGHSLGRISAGGCHRRARQVFRALCIRHGPAWDTEPRQRTFDQPQLLPDHGLVPGYG